MPKKKFKRLPTYIPPPSRIFDDLLQAERAAIAEGDTAGLDPDKSYLAVRVGREKQLPVWVICTSPLDATRIEGAVLFVASITLGSAIYLVKQGAEVLPDVE